MHVKRQRATRARAAPIRGGPRPGSGPKSEFPGKRWEHCVSLTDRALALLDDMRGDRSRNDYIEALLRTHAHRVHTTVDRAGPKSPRSLRLTDDGSRLLRSHTQRAHLTSSELVETLILNHA